MFGRPNAGGEGGIRTHGGREPTAVFKTAALNHSATSPDRTAIPSARQRVQAARRCELSPSPKLVSYKNQADEGEYANIGNSGGGGAARRHAGGAAGQRHALARDRECGRGPTSRA